MAGTGERHCVLVLRLGEVCTSPKEEIESAVSEVGPETLQVVGPELVHHDDDDEPGPRNATLRPGRGGRQSNAGGGQKRLQWKSVAFRRGVAPARPPSNRARGGDGAFSWCGRLACTCRLLPVSRTAWASRPRLSSLSCSSDAVYSGLGDGDRFEAPAAADEQDLGVRAARADLPRERDPRKDVASGSPRRDHVDTRALSSQLSTGLSISCCETFRMSPAAIQEATSDEPP